MAGTQEPGTHESSAQEPTGGEPAASQPAASQPAASQPAGGPGALRRLWPLWALLAVVIAVGATAPFLPGTPGKAVAGAQGQSGLKPPGAAGPPGAGQASPLPTAEPSLPPQQQTPEQVASTTRVTGKLARALRSWRAGPGGLALTLVSVRAGSALQAGGIKLFASMKASCAGLAGAVSQARSAPTVPDADLRGKYAAALTGLASAASDCQHAISTQAHGEEYVATEENGTLLRRSQSELTAGMQRLSPVTAVVAAAARH